MCLNNCKIKVFKSSKNDYFFIFLYVIFELLFANFFLCKEIQTI